MSLYASTRKFSSVCLLPGHQAFQASISSACTVPLSLHLLISFLPLFFPLSSPSIQPSWILLCELGGLRASLKVHLSMDPPHTVTFQVSQQHTCPVLLPKVPQASGLLLAANIQDPWLPLGSGCCPQSECLSVPSWLLSSSLLHSQHWPGSCSDRSGVSPMCFCHDLCLVRPPLSCIALPRCPPILNGPSQGASLSSMVLLKV